MISYTAVPWLSVTSYLFSCRFPYNLQSIWNLLQKHLTRKYIQHGPVMAQQIEAAAKPELELLGPTLHGRRKPVSADYHLTTRSRFWRGYVHRCEHTQVIALIKNENQTKEVREGGRGCVYLCGNDSVIRKALYLKRNWTDWWLGRVLFCVSFGIKLPHKSLANTGYLVGQVERRAHKGQEGERVFQRSFSGNHHPRAN